MIRPAIERLDDRAAGAAPPPVQWPVVGAALTLLAGLAWQIGPGARMAALLGLGAALGYVLYHASFGFTAAWRRLILAKDGRGVAAQLVMVGLASALFAPGSAPPAARKGGIERWWRGGWPVLWGAVGLAALNWATLAIAGHPWAINALCFKLLVSFKAFCSTIFSTTRNPMLCRVS